MNRSYSSCRFAPRARLTGSTGDAPGGLPVRLRSRLLPEDCGLSKLHDFAEAPRIGCVEHPMFLLEVPGLLGGILCQRPLGFGERLGNARSVF
jgi:hypothetical protein